MNPRHGEVWLVDMGMVAKTRPAVVLIADNLDAPRSLIIHIPVTRQNRGSELEVPLGHLPKQRRVSSYEQLLLRSALPQPRCESA